jgi:hypothetical protein
VKEQPVIVTVDNFVRAETDTYFASMIAEGELRSIEHKRADSRRPPDCHQKQ